MEIDKSEFLRNYSATYESQSFLQRWLRKQDAHSLSSFVAGFSCCQLEYQSAFLATNDKPSGASLIPWEKNNPNESDLLIIGGSLNFKLYPYILEMYASLMRPCWVVALGACAIKGGPYHSAASYAVMPEINSIIPVDVFIPGCPPHPETIKQGFELLRARILAGISAENKLAGEAGHAISI